MRRHLSPERVEALAGGSVATGDDGAHLGQCPRCAAAVRDARGRRRLLQSLVPYTLSDMAFRRVEARLGEVASAGPGEERPVVRWWMVAAGTAAVIAAAVVARLPERATVAVETPPSVAEGVVQPLTVISASADARARTGGEPWRPVTAGDVVDRREAVFGSRVVLAAPLWTFVVSGAAGVGGGASVSLGAGDLRARVDGPVHVVAGGLHVSSADGVFAVSRAAAEVVVDVSSGSVELTDSVATRRLAGPVRVRWADGSGVDVEDGPPPAVEVPAAPAPPYVTFDASSLPAGTRVSLDGVALGEAPFTTLVGAGPHRLGLTEPGKVEVVSMVELTAGHYAPAVPEEERPLAPAAVAQIRRELERHRPAFQACFEKWLKSNPSAGGLVELRLVVSPQGRVRSADVAGTRMPAGPAGCLERTAQTIRLPAVGSELELALPFRLTTVR